MNFFQYLSAFVLIVATFGLILKYLFRKQTCAKCEEEDRLAGVQRAAQLASSANIEYDDDSESDISEDEATPELQDPPKSARSSG